MANDETGRSSCGNFNAFDSCVPNRTNRKSWYADAAKSDTLGVARSRGFATDTDRGLRGNMMIRYLSAMTATLVLAGFASAAGIEFFLEQAKDFGTSPRGPVLTHYFTVKNTTNQTMILGTPRVSCGCVSANTLKNTLAPGESTAVVAMMDTKRIPQANTSKTVIVFVTVQLGNSVEEVQLRVTSIARDDLVISPEQLAFGTVRKGQGGKVTTKLTFYSDPNWKIIEAVSNGAYVKASIAPVAKAPGTAGAAYEVTATLDADCPVGNWTADIWVKSTAFGMEKMRLPVSVNVVAPIDVKPDAVQFTDAVATVASEQKLMLTSGQAFKILEIKGIDSELEVAKPGDAARPVHILKLTFKAKKAGETTKTLEIVTDHPEQKTIVITVTGKVAGK